MIENLLFGLNAVLPLFMLAALGYFLKASCYVTEKGFEDINHLCFKIIMPLMLFKNVYNSDFHSDFNPTMLMIGEVGIIVVALLLGFICSFIIKDSKVRGSFVHASYRSNYLIMGIPIAEAIYGPGVNAQATMLLAIVVPTFTLIAVPLLTSCGQKNKVSVFNIVFSTIKNPIIIGIFAGLFLNLARFPMPSSGMSFITLIASMATPLAMMTVGARIELKNCINRYVIISATLKLVILPALFVLLSLRCGLYDEALLIIYILFASPSAINSYTMSSNLGCDEDVAADCVFVSTMLSVITFTVGIAILKTLQFI